MEKKELLLSVKNLTVEYTSDGEVIHAVNDVSFELEKGKTIGLVGETGAGKTTIAKSILRILPEPPAKVKSGTIEFEGKELLSLPEDQMRKIRGKNISMIFQDPMTALNPIMRIGEQIAEVIELHEHCGKAEAVRKAKKMLEMVNIPGERYYEYPHQFSGGMKQRVVIAMALACNPDLLLADEPTTALDVTIQAQVLDMINDLKKEFNTSMIMITHDLGVVASLCDRIAILYGGKIVETGTTDEIFYETKHPYTLGLLGSIARRQAQRDGTFIREEIHSIPGTPPDLLKINAGCPFVNRCPEAMRICKDYLPATVDFSPSHAACCWKYCKEQAQALVVEQDRKRGEQNG